MRDGRGRGSSTEGSTAVRGTLEVLRDVLSWFFAAVVHVSRLVNSAARGYVEGVGDGGTKRERRKAVGEASEVHETRWVESAKIVEHIWWS